MLAPAEKSPPRVLAEARTYDELHAALRNRADQLQVSRAQLDYLSGLQSGYCGKLLSKTRIKNFGRQSLGPLLTVLGLCLQVVEDPAAMARIGPRLTKRNAASVRYANGRTRKKRPELDSAWGKRMAALRVLTQTPCERSRIARLAAVSRWKWRDIKEATRAAAKPKPKPMTRQAREARLALDRKPNGGRTP
jgi:hypothetical protein